ncbi:hypothetical protein GGR50DRAFT_373963 [Xylaria sp. CBS 124048]|nr:hypothetical protein GGR50DRAFT_373963 [Xylaria sp. CBS 124048]
MTTMLPKVPHGLLESGKRRGTEKKRGEGREGGGGGGGERGGGDGNALLEGQNPPLTYSFFFFFLFFSFSFRFFSGQKRQARTGILFHPRLQSILNLNSHVYFFFFSPPIEKQSSPSCRTAFAGYFLPFFPSFGAIIIIHVLVILSRYSTLACGCELSTEGLNILRLIEPLLLCTWDS